MLEKDEIIIQPYHFYVEQFNAAVDILTSIVATPDDVNGLPSEVEQLEFIKSFRVLMRVRNVLMTYSEFKWDDVEMSAQRFEDFKSKYLDLYEDTKSSEGEAASIIDDVDFELELIQRDEINVAYISIDNTYRYRYTQLINSKLSLRPFLMKFLYLQIFGFVISEK